MSDVSYLCGIYVRDYKMPILGSSTLEIQSIRFVIILKNII
jgi:hypothetical protein